MRQINIPIYKISLGDCEGLTKMSLVEFPAVESDFIAFDKQEPNGMLKLSLDEEKHIVFGCALRANYPIYREDSFGSYYVVFDTETINQLYEKFMRDGLTSNVNLEHYKDTDGVYMIQSFLKDTKHGISPEGFEDVEDGSWFVAYKIDNQGVWEDVKQHKFNGFSVECFVEVNKQEDELEVLINELIK